MVKRFSTTCKEALISLEDCERVCTALYKLQKGYEVEYVTIGSCIYKISMLRLLEGGKYNG